MDKAFWCKKPQSDALLGTGTKGMWETGEGGSPTEQETEAETVTSRGENLRVQHLTHSQQFSIRVYD